MKGLLLYIPPLARSPSFSFISFGSRIKFLESWIKQYSSNISTIRWSKYQIEKREDELQLNIDELETEEAELKRIVSELKQQLSELRENKEDSYNLDLEIKQEEVNFTNELFNTQSKRRVAEMAYGQDDVSQ